MKPKLMEHLANISLLAEFDHPPLLETTVVVKDGGLKRRQTFDVKRTPHY